MGKFDRDIDWSTTKSMSFCVCQHREKSHRPISRKCSICECPAFTVKKEQEADVKAPRHLN